MKNRKRKSPWFPFMLECEFCGEDFYAKTEAAKYCSDSHKVLFCRMVKASRQWYGSDPNEGVLLPPGTVTSSEMPESSLVFKGRLVQLLNELPKHISPEQISKEIEFIESIKPFSKTHQMTKSSVQIFTENNLIEVFRITPVIYKLYTLPLEDGI
jgi:hypothetical protein